MHTCVKCMLHLPRTFPGLPRQGGRQAATGPWIPSSRLEPSPTPFPSNYASVLCPQSDPKGDTPKSPDIASFSVLSLRPPLTEGIKTYSSLHKRSPQRTLWSLLELSC